MHTANKILFIGATAALLVSAVLLTRSRDRAEAAQHEHAGAPAGGVVHGGGALSLEERARAETTSRLALEGAPVITVYKTPTCGCCKAWVEHLRAHGFQVETHDKMSLRSIKEEYGVPRELESCHTAVVDGYVVEGHVPADLIERMLKERPQIAGLTVPGMPMGSPGMEGPRKDPYDVLTFDREGKTTVYDRR